MKLNLIALRLLLFFGLLVLGQSCMPFKYTFVSPGRVEPEQLDQNIWEFSQALEKKSNYDGPLVEVIAHGAGSWRFYPMGVNRKGLVYGNGLKNKKTRASNVNDLIDQTLTLNPEISIELDVHYPPPGTKFPENQGIIIHDQIEWGKKRYESAEVEKYFKENTLSQVLEHFTRNKYYLKSKIYLEIKTTKDCDQLDAPESCKSQYYKLANELESFLKEHRRPDGSRWFTITSFSTQALQEFRNLAIEKGFDHMIHYGLIVGYTGGWIKGGLAQSKGYVPKFKERQRSFLANTNWLNEVWISSRGLQHFEHEMNHIMELREKEKGLSPLPINIATYEMKKGKMLRRINDGENLNSRFKSFMIDIDDKSLHKMTSAERQAMIQDLDPRSFNLDFSQYNQPTSIYCVQLSELAYFNKAEIMVFHSQFLKQFPESKQEFEFLEYSGKGNDTQALLWANPKFMVISFRGTEPSSLIDWFTDGKFWNYKNNPSQNESLYNMPPGHGGFRTSLMNLMSDEIDIMAKVEKLRLKVAPNSMKSEYPIFLTGHSLGAAISQMCIEPLNYSGFNFQGAYHFAPPLAVACSEREYMKKEYGDKVYDIVNFKDYVPRAGRNGVAHFGKFMRICKDGSLCWEKEAYIKFKWWEYPSEIRLHMLGSHLKAVKDPKNSLSEINQRSNSDSGFNCITPRNDVDLCSGEKL